MRTASWVVALAFLGCGGHGGSLPGDDAAVTAAPDAPAAPTGVLPAGLIGTWNVTTAYFTPEGGQPQLNSALIGKPIMLTAAGDYTFNGGAGTWSVTGIVAADWVRWAIGPYINTRKVVFLQPGQTIDGPLSETGSSIAGFQVIYRSTTGPAGRTELQFGRSKR
jgi:hypothetical protein